MPYADPVHQQLPYQSGSETSRDAAIAAAPSAGAQRTIYADWLKVRGLSGGTDAEAERELGMRRSSICARRNEWMHLCRVQQHPFGLRREKCAVWVWVG